MARSDLKTCENCGDVFSRQSVRPISARKWDRRRFCSRPCLHAFQRGEKHPCWRGDDVTAQGGRKRAIALYPPEPCEVCGAEAERHHIDGNTLNNARENIAFLCTKHHIEAEDRYAHLRKPEEEIRERRRRWARARWARQTDEERQRNRDRQREYMREYRQREAVSGR